MYHNAGDDCAKRRLVERAHILVAVDFLMEKGCHLEDIAPQLSRFYYVDIDTLNEVLAGRLAETATKLDNDKDWRQVA